MARRNKPVISRELLLAILIAGSRWAQGQAAPNGAAPSPNAVFPSSQDEGGEHMRISSPGDPRASRCNVCHSAFSEEVRLTDTQPPPPTPPNSDRALTWNAWVEDDTGKQQLSFQPLDRLRTAQPYIVGVDLAAFAYKALGSSVASQQASSSLQRWLDGQKRDIVGLKALVVPDPAFFTGSDQSFVDLTINRASKDKYYAQTPSPPKPADPMGELHGSSSQSYRFGSLVIPLKIHTDTREGLTYLAISFWDGMHPLDSIVVPVCISQSDAPAPCGPLPSRIFGTSNDKRLNVGAPDPETEAAAASLHFIELPNFTWAVLRTDTASEPVPWQLGRLSQIKEDVEAVLANFATATTDPSRLVQGVGLFNAVAPPNSAGRAVFQKLLAGRRAAASAPPPLIWVRVDPLQPDQWFSIPLALAAVDSPAPGGRQMLGDWFRVQSTLRRQDYQSLKNCISKWMKLLPPSIAGFAGAESLLMGPRGSLDNFHNNTTEFSDWIGDGKPVDEPTVLMTFSHYYKGGIGFDQSNWVPPKAIQRSFTQPSVALIEGCDGALPDADGFLKQLNMVGFQAIMTTISSVKPYEAAQYFEILNRKLADPARYTLSRAHFEAVKEMEKTPQRVGMAPYGLRAQMFSLLGDGSLRVCPSP